MSIIECDPSIHLIVCAVWMFLVIGFLSLIPGGEWTVVKQILLINGKIFSSVS